MKYFKSMFKAPKCIEDKATDYDKGFRDGAMFAIFLFALFYAIKVIIDFL